MGRVSTEVKERALGLLKTGHTKTQVCEMTGVKFPTIEKWAKQLETESSVPVTAGVVNNAGPVLVSSEKGAPLEEQLGGMNTDSGIPTINPTPAEPASSILPPQSEVPKVEAQVELAPEALVALVKLVKSGFINMAAAGYQIKLDHKELDRLASFTPLEEEQLKVLAPFAASYAGQFEQYTRPVMASLFFVAVGISSMRSFKELKALQPPKPMKPPIKSGAKVDK